MKPSNTAALILAAAVLPAQPAESISDYLVSNSIGPVGASDLLGLSGTVSNLQSPRDIALALGALGTRDTQAGFGIAVAPGRSAVGVRASSYVEEDAVFTRIWAGTTFSYAQNKKTIGTTDYSQSAVAVAVTYHLNYLKDPVVVAYRAMTGGDGPCKSGLAALDEAEEKVEAFILRRTKEEEARLQRTPTKQEREAIVANAPAELEAAAKKKLAAVRTCAHDAVKEAAKEWNSSRLQVMLGEARIRSAAGDGVRYTLGRYAAASLALKAGDNGLLNVTLRRAADELDVTTLAKTPIYKSGSKAALRYTHKAGKDNDQYGLVEVSNVKAATPTTSNAAFRYAFGLDRKLAEGLWLEFRFGRARIADGSKLENKGMLTLNFSPEATLETQAKKAK